MFFLRECRVNRRHDYADDSEKEGLDEPVSCLLYVNMSAGVDIKIKWLTEKDAEGEAEPDLDRYFNLRHNGGVLFAVKWAIDVYEGVDNHSCLAVWQKSSTRIYIHSQTLFKKRKRKPLFCDFFFFNNCCHSGPSDILIDLLVLIFPPTLIVPRRGGVEVSALGKYSAMCCEYCVFCIH